MGGKSPLAPQRTGAWIADQLPYRNGYLEPFAGMLGVLLHRRRSGLETVNDVDGRVTNWWSTIQNDWSGFIGLLERTAINAERTFGWATQRLDEGGVVGAVAFTVYQVSGTSWGSYRLQVDKKARSFPVDRVMGLAERLREVQILERDAVGVLDRFSGVANQVVYVDPPYRSSSGSRMYNRNEVDWGSLTEVLLAQKGLVAVSGYNDEWSHLDWRVTEKPTYASHIPSSGRGYGRSERLWMNYDPLGGGLF